MSRCPAAWAELVSAEIAWTEIAWVQAAWWWAARHRAARSPRGRTATAACSRACRPVQACVGCARGPAHAMTSSLMSRRSSVTSHPVAGMEDQLEAVGDAPEVQLLLWHPPLQLLAGEPGVLCQEREVDLPGDDRAGLQRSSKPSPETQDQQSAEELPDGAGARGRGERPLPRGRAPVFWGWRWAGAVGPSARGPCSGFRRDVCPRACLGSCRLVARGGVDVD